MAYNNYGNYGYYNPYGTYQPQYSQAPQVVPQIQQPVQQPVQQSQQQSGFIWIQGEAGAKAYPVAAGNTVLLMDSENPVIYMKSTDQSGRPLPMRTFDLVERDNNPQWVQSSQSHEPPVDMSQFVRNNELEDRVTEIVNRLMGGA